MDRENRNEQNNKIEKHIDDYKKDSENNHLKDPYESFLNDVKKNGYDNESLAAGAILNSYYTEYSIIKDLNLEGLEHGNEKEARWLVYDNDKYIILNRNENIREAVYVKDKENEEIVDDSCLDLNEAENIAYELNEKYSTDIYIAATENEKHFEFDTINLRTGEFKKIDQYDALPGRLSINENYKDIRDSLQEKYGIVAENESDYAKMMKNSIDVMNEYINDQESMNQINKRNKRR